MKLTFFPSNKKSVCLGLRQERAEQLFYFVKEEYIIHLEAYRSFDVLLSTIAEECTNINELILAIMSLQQFISIRELEERFLKIK